MAISGHRSEESLGNYIGRPSIEKPRTYLDILSNASSGRPHRSQKAGFTALSYLAIFMLLWIRMSCIHKTHTISSLFCNFHVKKIACIYELVGRNTRLHLVFLPPSNLSFVSGHWVLTRFLAAKICFAIFYKKNLSMALRQTPFWIILITPCTLAKISAIVPPPRYLNRRQ